MSDPRNADPAQGDCQDSPVMTPPPQYPPPQSDPTDPPNPDAGFLECCLAALCCRCLYGDQCNCDPSFTCVC
ncbi:hypothetical protein Dimus_017546 [Dionaea muscipula]